MGSSMMGSKSVSYLATLEGIFLIFGQVGQDGLQALWVDGAQLGDVAPNAGQQILVGADGLVQGAWPVMDFQGRHVGQKVIARLHGAPAHTSAAADLWRTSFQRSD